MLPYFPIVAGLLWLKGMTVTIILIHKRSNARICIWCIWFTESNILSFKACCCSGIGFKNFLQKGFQRFLLPVILALYFHSRAKRNGCSSLTHPLYGNLHFHIQSSEWSSNRLGVSLKHLLIALLYRRREEEHQ